MVAQRFVVDHPDRVSALVLMGAFSTFFQDPGHDRLLPDRPLRRSPIQSIAAFAREWQLSTLALAMPVDHLDTVVAETLKVPARVWHEAFKGFLETPDFSSELAGVTVPTLILWGDRDTYALRASQDRLRSVIPGAKLLVYEGNGHALHWEDPIRFTSDLASFLTSGSIRSCSGQEIVVELR